MNGTLYLVGTPIGNRQDITLRALETLRSVDCIACEDTRHTRPLLQFYDISKPLISYYQPREHEGARRILNLLFSGKSVALVTDAGMPCISDPGAVVVRAAREAGVDVHLVPGPSALSGAPALAGIEGGLVFLGFLPEKTKARDALVDAFAHSPLPLVLYCAPHDLQDTLAYLLQKLGDRPLFSVKELTKIYEQVYAGTLSSPNIENGKGEFVLIVGACPPAEAPDPTALVHTYLQQGLSHSEAVKRAARETGASKHDLYAATLPPQEK